MHLFNSIGLLEVTNALEQDDKTKKFSAFTQLSQTSNKS